MFLYLVPSEQTARSLIPRSMPTPSSLSVSLQSGNSTHTLIHQFNPSKDILGFIYLAFVGISRSYEKNKKGESYCKTNNVIKKEKLLLKRNHRLTNIRKNYLNQTTSEIVSRKPRFICIEDLNVSGMMKNRHLSKAVQNQGFFEFRKQLEHKCRDKGIQLIVADRFYPSSKLCSCCGNIKKDLKLSDRVYRCACGNMIDRDFQASINLKTYGEKFAG